MIDFNRLLRDDITYWSLGSTNAQGFIGFSAPILLKGRWEDRREQVVDDKGEEITTDSVAYLPQKVDVDGYLHQGDKRSVADPTTLPQARRIAAFRSIPPVSGEPEDESESFNRALLKG